MILKKWHMWIGALACAGLAGPALAADEAPVGDAAANLQLVSQFLSICGQPKTRLARIAAQADADGWAAIDPTAFVDFSKYGADRDGSNLVDVAWEFEIGAAVVRVGVREGKYGDACHVYTELPSSDDLAAMEGVFDVIDEAPELTVAFVKARILYFEVDALKQSGVYYTGTTPDEVTNIHVFYTNPRN